MAFDLQQPVTSLPVTGLFASALAGRNTAVDGVVRLSVLHCEICGDEIPFDALSALCRCSQECYGPLSSARPASAAA